MVANLGSFGYLNVQNPKVLEENLESIWIGSYKLRVNFPMFDQEVMREAPKLQRNFNTSRQNVKPQPQGTAYATALVGGRNNSHPKWGANGTRRYINRNVQQRGNKEYGMEFKVAEKDLEWLKT